MAEQDQSEKFSELRKRAEELAEKQLSSIVFFSPEDSKTIIQDLRIHQIELELQNEELKITQRDLEISRHKYADLYEFSPVGLMTLDDHETIQEANLTFATLIGIDREGLVKHNLSDFIESGSQDSYHLFFQSLRTGQQTQPCEITLLSAAQIPLSVRLDGSILAQTGIQPSYRIAVSNITQHKQEEQQRLQLDTLLKIHRQRLENIIAAVPGIIWENHYDDETNTMKLVFISAYVETMLGYTVDEALAEPQFWDKIFHPEDAQNINDAFYKVHQSGKASVLSFRALHKDGHSIDIDTHMTAIMKGEKPIVTRGVMMDMSERQRLVQVQAHYATMLRRSNEELQQFAYIASHDLQEPLRMVTSYLQIIDSRYAEKLDSDAHEFIAFAVEGAARMKALISDLLAYSQVDGGEKAFENFDMQIAFDKALANLSLKIEDTAALITHDVLPSIKADPMQMTQLFQNLIGNALKFQRETVPQVHISVERKGNQWQFAVRDNGIGIASEHLDRIFVIFQRLYKKDEYPGTGIGLAICKKVVERHGGRMWVESVLGEGTTFYFTLPI